MNHKNCHARSKQKRKQLRLRNRMRSILEKRNAKIQKAMKPKGRTLFGPVITQVEFAKEIYHGQYKAILDHDKVLRLNQRQKRKIRRQQPHGRK